MKINATSSPESEQAMEKDEVNAEHGKSKNKRKMCDHELISAPFVGACLNGSKEVKPSFRFFDQRFAYGAIHGQSAEVTNCFWDSCVSRKPFFTETPNGLRGATNSATDVLQGSRSPLCRAYQNSIFNDELDLTSV